MDITKSSKTELQSLAYEYLVQIEKWQRDLQMINQEIAKRNQETIDNSSKDRVKEVVEKVDKKIIK